MENRTIPLAAFHESDVASERDDVDVHASAARESHDVFERKMAAGVEAIRQQHERLPSDLHGRATLAFEFLKGDIEAVVEGGVTSRRWTLPVSFNL